MTDTEKKIEELLISKGIQYENRNGKFWVERSSKDMVDETAFAAVRTIGKNICLNAWYKPPKIMLADKTAYMEERICIARDLLNEWAKRYSMVFEKGKKIVLENMRDCIEEAEWALVQLKQACDNDAEISRYSSICDEMANKYNSTQYVKGMM